MPMPTGNGENPQFHGQWTVKDSQNWLFAKRSTRQRSLSAWTPCLLTLKNDSATEFRRVSFLNPSLRQVLDSEYSSHVTAFNSGEKVATKYNLKMSSIWTKTALWVSTNWCQVRVSMPSLQCPQTFNLSKSMFEELESNLVPMPCCSQSDKCATRHEVMLKCGFTTLISVVSRFVSLDGELCITLLIVCVYAGN